MHPQVTVFIEVQHRYLVGGKFAFMAFVGSLERKKAITIKTLQTINSGQPYITFAILHNAVDKIRSQSVGGGKMRKGILFGWLGPCNHRP